MNERNFGIKTIIRNKDARETFRISFLEAIPWYFKVFVSSLEIRENETTIKKPGNF